MSPKQRPEFKTGKERSQWITDNAEYWRASAVINRRPFSEKHLTEAEATAAAKRLANTWRKPFMIYAVCGSEDTWVKNVFPGITNDERGR
jgi:hypothetical protein